MSGKLIVIEGLEGAGKSTAVHTVVEYLAKKQIRTLTTREPGGTVIGEILRNLIKNPEYRGVLDDRSELLLLYTARIQLIEEVIKPALHDGIWVIADRFELSSRAYQGGGRGLDHNMIDRLSAFTLKGLEPDLILYLDISPEEGMKRVKSRGAFDRIEQQPIEFFYRVHKTYIHYMKQCANSVMINAGLPLQEVNYAIENAMNIFCKQNT